MRIIQSYNTFEDPFSSSVKGGFTTLRNFKKFMKDSYVKHKELTDNYTMYTDSVGFEIMKEIMSEDDIEVIEFDIIANDRFLYAGKFQTAALQIEPYVHVDLDLIMYKLPELEDVMVEEMSTGIFLANEVDYLGIATKGIRCRPYSGIIGFGDMEFKNLYIKEVMARYPVLESMPKISSRVCITLEEVLLQRLILDHNKKVFSMNKDDFKHLRGSIK